MEIESMVANSALIRAREGGKGRSWRWKDMLRFPHISRCINLLMSIDRDYTSLCVKQPIGQELFYLFCRSRPDLQNCISLLEALDNFERKSDEERKDSGTSIIQTFLSDQSPQYLQVVQSHEQSCRERLSGDPCGNIFCDCREALHMYLKGWPFLEYQRSVYFDRFLQWKMVERQPITKNIFRQYRLLGKGGFGEVWACQERASGQMYACKKLEKTHVKNRGGEAMALNEKLILEKIDSRFVVSLAYAYETKHDLCLVLTLLNGGDLRFHIYKMGHRGLDQDRVRFYAAEVCCGLNHLHQNSIVYRDLKPENILLDDNGHIRISDLGLAVELSEGALVKSRVGTVGYMAPEVVRHQYYGFSPDWWGLGCLIYEMTAGRPPFREHGQRLHEAELERLILEEEVEYTKMFSFDLKDLCRSLLAKDPKQRLGCQASGVKGVQSHPYFNKINFRMLEAGLVEPPFKPDPRQVYCNDVQDIDEFTTVKGVTLDQTDAEFYSKFCTGAVPISWQNEMIEMGCFKELNVFGPGDTRTPDLNWTLAPSLQNSRRSLLDRIFRRLPLGEFDGNRRRLACNEISIDAAGLTSSTH
ncbi:G protein-coupled receptor kinase 6-like [Aplochiton taeniatus]